MKVRRPRPGAFITSAWADRNERTSNRAIKSVLWSLRPRWVAKDIRHLPPGRKCSLFDYQEHKEETEWCILGAVIYRPHGTAVPPYKEAEPARARRGSGPGTGTSSYRTKSSGSAPGASSVSGGVPSSRAATGKPQTAEGAVCHGPVPGRPEPGQRPGPGADDVVLVEVVRCAGGVGWRGTGVRRGSDPRCRAGRRSSPSWWRW